MLSFVVVILSLFCCDKVYGSSLCSSSSDTIKLHMTSDTPYRYVANWNDSQYRYEGCTAVKFWAMIRHGTRNPGIKIIRKMNDRLPVLQNAILESFMEGKVSLCDQEIQDMSKWISQVVDEDRSVLTHEGEDELLELGERYQKRFPELLPELYINSTFKFQYTDTQRTKKSAHSFAMGLFGRNISRHVWYPEAVYRDPILRFYKLCKRWCFSVKKNPKAFSEVDKFVEGSEISQVRERITKKLGLTEILNYDDIKLMYRTCAYETAWSRFKLSPWCAVFSEADLMVLEYAQDLQYYWINGYGFEVNYKQACPPLKDMYSFFRSDQSNSSVLPQAVLYFSHAGTIMKMLALLGVYQDKEPLMASNFHEMLHHRLWRSSQISTFGANIAFVLYKCGLEDKVLTLHQERPIKLPGCPSSDDLCPLARFKDAYLSSVEQCDFHDICSWENNDTSGAPAA